MQLKMSFNQSISSLKKYNYFACAHTLFTRFYKAAIFETNIFVPFCKLKDTYLTYFGLTRQVNLYKKLPLLMANYYYQQ